MWRIVYKNDRSRVLYAGSTTEEQCYDFLIRKFYTLADFIVERVQ